METIPSPTVIEVDFTVKPVADAAPPPARPAPPVPFRKRTSFLPVRFFSPKRLPRAASPAAANEPGEVNASPRAAEATGEAGDGAPLTLLVLPPPPAETPEVPVEAAPVPAVVAETPEAFPAPMIPVTAAAPEPAAADVDQPAAPPEPPASVPAAPAPPPAPAVNADSRAEEGGAAVQLTLSCEVADLRLTPSFGLGAVRLRTLSDVVSLRFVSPGEAGNPLAAAVAFQIVHVELNPASRRLNNLLLKPLDHAREPVAPHPRLQVAGVGLVRGDPGDPAPITVTAAAQTSTAVQVLGTFRLGNIQFTPGFGVATLRLELASDTVLARVSSSAPPPPFDLVEVELDAQGRLAGLRLTPGAAAAAGVPRL